MMQLLEEMAGEGSKRLGWMKSLTRKRVTPRATVHFMALVPDQTLLLDMANTNHPLDQSSSFVCVKYACLIA